MAVSHFLIKLYFKNKRFYLGCNYNRNLLIVFLTAKEPQRIYPMGL